MSSESQDLNILGEHQEATPKFAEIAELRQESKKWWEMTRQEFENYFQILFHGFISVREHGPSEEDLANFEKAHSNPELEKSREIIEPLLPDHLRSKLKEVTGYNPELVSAAHRNVIERGIESGVVVPDRVLIDYPNLQDKSRIKNLEREKTKEVNQQLISVILSNFDNIDKATNRNRGAIKTEFEKLLRESGIADVAVDITGESVLFKDTKMSLTYVAVFRNTMPSKVYGNCFDIVDTQGRQGRSNAYVIKLEMPAVAGEFVDSRKATIRYAAKRGKLVVNA